MGKSNLEAAIHMENRKWYQIYKDEENFQGKIRGRKGFYGYVTVLYFGFYMWFVFYSGIRFNGV